MPAELYRDRFGDLTGAVGVAGRAADRVADRGEIVEMTGEERALVEGAEGSMTAAIYASRRTAQGDCLQS